MHMDMHRGAHAVKVFPPEIWHSAIAENRPAVLMTPRASCSSSGWPGAGGVRLTTEGEMGTPRPRAEPTSSAGW